MTHRTFRPDLCSGLPLICLWLPWHPSKVQIGFRNQHGVLSPVVWLPPKFPDKSQVQIALSPLALLHSPVKAIQAVQHAS